MFLEQLSNLVGNNTQQHTVESVCATFCTHHLHILLTIPTYVYHLSYIYYLTELCEVREITATMYTTIVLCLREFSDPSLCMPLNQKVDVTCFSTPISSRTECQNAFDTCEYVLLKLYLPKGSNSL